MSRHIFSNPFLIIFSSRSLSRLLREYYPLFLHLDAAAEP